MASNKANYGLDTFVIILPARSLFAASVTNSSNIVFSSQMFQRALCESHSVRYNIDEFNNILTRHNLVDKWERYYGESTVSEQKRATAAIWPMRRLAKTGSANPDAAHSQKPGSCCRSAL